jgi:hypothetical protein
VQKEKDTSWEKMAVWYDSHLKSGSTYQQEVILPNLLRFDPYPIQ